MEPLVIQCKNCGHEFSGKYCNECGEKVYGRKEKTVKYIFEEALHFITHFEGNFFTSLKTIFKAPGKLSRDYCDGIRKRYYKPVSMFFFVIVIYLLFPGIFPQGLNMKMEYHAGQYPYQAYATRMIEAKMQQRHLTQEQLSDKFHEVSHNVSKFMLFVLLPLSAAILLLLFPRKGVFYDHFMLGTEINVFFLVFSFLIMPFIIGIVVAVISSMMHAPFNNNLFEMVSIVFDAVIMFAFCFIAFRRFYQSSKSGAAIKALIFAPVHYVLVFFLYKFLLFNTIMAML